MGKEAEKQPKIALIIMGVMLSVFLAALDGTITSTAMPKIIGDLRGMALYNWPFTLYMLCSTIAIPIFGRIADLTSHKLTYIIGIAIFLVGSFLCGISNNMMQLIAFRGIQGIGGGTLIANSFVIVGDLFAPAERAKIMGLVASMFGLSSIVGPVLGGVITDMLSWHWIFFVNIPLGIIALVLIVSALPSAPVKNEKRKFDLAGAAVFVLALVPLLLLMTWGGKRWGWVSPPIIGMAVVAAIMFGVFFIVEKRAVEPFIPLGHFKNKIFTLSLTGAFLANSLMFGIIILMPLFVQKVLGLSATGSGAVLTPMSVVVAVSGIITGLVITKTGRYKIFGILAFVLICSALFLLQKINFHTSYLQIIIMTITLGIGVGMTLPVFDLASQNAFPHHQIGIITAMLQFIRNIGGTLGSAIWGAFLASNINATVQNHHQLNGIKERISNSVQQAFFIAVFIGIIGLIAVLFLKEIPLRKTNQDC